MSRPPLQRYAIGFALLLGFDTLAQIGFKLGGAHALPPQAEWAWLLRLLASPWLYAALLGYVGAFFTWMKLLEHAPIGPAFAASHLEVVSVLLLSAWWFGEPIGMVQVLGAVLIVAGIACLALGERTAPADAH
ncbi:DMT family transporter [Xanthomonas sp. NCPPB 2654]|uniref:DMT family transporter n=1 Tax=unclassified Xanthomonas TaxID=2643310 RepID=UPI0021E0EF54|nr:MULTISPECIES: DMT family transporter [unclassified Xanthomonas]MDL5366013.1 DMT family transporter [Xanthomonas sp. NCPPB 2654]UYC22444.1 DMT family transporter [Xanthomonas sp. CFBP 8443]